MSHVPIQPLCHLQFRVSFNVYIYDGEIEIISECLVIFKDHK